jgi:UDP-3-O-[3-hydroxymyristoyl] glucosamine N-acyltransferase
MARTINADLNNRFNELFDFDGNKNLKEIFIDYLSRKEVNFENVSALNLADQTLKTPIDVNKFVEFLNLFKKLDDVALPQNLYDLKHLSLAYCSVLTSINIAARKEMEKLDVSKSGARTIVLNEHCKVDDFRAPYCQSLFCVTIKEGSKVGNLKLYLSNIEFLKIENGCEIDNLDLSLCQNLSELGNLDIADDCKIRKISLSGCKWVNNETLQKIIEKFPDLESLNISNLENLDKTLKIPAGKIFKQLDVSHNDFEHLIIGKGCEIGKLNLYFSENLKKVTIESGVKIKTLITLYHSFIDDFTIEENCNIGNLVSFKRTAEGFEEKRFSNVKNFTIKDNCTVGKVNFSNCKLLQNVIIKKGSKVESLDLSGSGVENLTIEENCEIDFLNLYNCKKLKNLTLSKGAKIQNVLLNSSYVENLIIEDNCKIGLITTTICKSLKNVAIGNGNTVDEIKLFNKEIADLKIGNNCSVGLVALGIAEIKNFLIGSNSNISFLNLADGKVENFTIDEGCKVQNLDLSASKITNFTIKKDAKIDNLFLNDKNYEGRDVEIENMNLEIGCTIFGIEVKNQEDILKIKAQMPESTQQKIKISIKDPQAKTGQASISTFVTLNNLSK